jgi:hypothetical protein
MGQMVWFLFGLGLGLALDWMLVKVMLKSLKERVKALELARSSGMDLPQQNLSYWRIEGPKLQQKVLDLEQELVRSEVQDLILQSALDSVQVKESELKQKVLNLEMELESIRSKTLWKQD